MRMPLTLYINSVDATAYLDKDSFSLKERVSSPISITTFDLHANFEPFVHADDIIEIMDADNKLIVKGVITKCAIRLDACEIFDRRDDAGYDLELYYEIVCNCATYE